MRRYPFFFFLLISFCGSAQNFPFDFWYEGKLVLESGDTLHGQVKYSLDDLIQFSKNRALETFTARKVVFFEIYDASGKRYRQFFSLPYAVTGQYKTAVFFELLEEGRMTLLAREAVEARTFSSIYSYGTYTKLVLVDKYFFLKEDGTIVPFDGKKSDLIELMGSRGDEVQKYAKENKLAFDKKYDVARMVGYYNSFFKR